MLYKVDKIIFFEKFNKAFIMLLSRLSELVHYKKNSLQYFCKLFRFIVEWIECLFYGNIDVYFCIFRVLCFVTIDFKICSICPV